ncbi:MAG: hypothetical protein AAB250_03115, partial [Bdellovibrionota bacterium]
WNAEHGRYDFIQFSGLKSGVLSAKPANRAFCVSCHQGGLPIFPRAPWSEMFEDKTFAKRGVIDKDLVKLSPQEREEKRFFISTFFDHGVRAGSLFLQKAKTCHAMCGSDLVCRRELLRAALDFPEENRRQIEFDHFLDGLRKGRTETSFVDRKSFDLKRLERLQAILEPLWPVDEYAHTSTTLLDRSLAAGAESAFALKGTLKNGEDPSFSDGFAHVPIARSPARGDVIQNDIDKYRVVEFSAGTMTEEVLMKKDLGRADPKRTRPLVGRIPKAEAARWASLVASECFKVSDEFRAIAKRSGKDSLDRAVKSKPVTEALCEWPSEPRRLASALREAIATKAEAVETPAQCTSSQPVLRAALDLPSNLADLPARGNFRKYCSECHGPGSDLALKLDDVKFLREFRGVYQPSIKRTLELRAMPPEGAPQPNSKELKAMLDVLSR